MNVYEIVESSTPHTGDAAIPEIQMSSVDSDCPDRFSSDFGKVVRDKYVNTTISFLLVIVGAYLTVISLFGRNIIHPLTATTLPVPSDIGGTVVSLSILLLASIALGWLLSIVKLPTLLGPLLMGIAFKNLPILSDTFWVDAHWEYCIRTLALCCIIVRWGIGLDAKAIKERPALPLFLGIITPILEAVAITLGAHFLFGLRLSLSIVCGFLLAAVSPAITVPVMIDLKKSGRGAEKDIPTSLLAAATLDNVICIAAFSTAVQLIFSTDSASITILWLILQIFCGVVGGCIIGVILWFFPLYKLRHAQYTRGVLLALATTTSVIGGGVVGWLPGGIICAVLICFVAAIKWKHDSDKSVRPLENAYRALWNFFFMPLLFALVGMKFDVEQINASHILSALALIGIGALARFIFSFFISKCALSTKESVFAALAMLPKATVQAALGPSLLLYSTTSSEMASEIELIVTAAIVSILVTATIGQLLLQLLAPILIDKDGEDMPTYIYKNDVDLKFADSQPYLSETRVATTTTTKYNGNGGNPFNSGDPRVPGAHGAANGSYGASPFTREMFQKDGKMSLRM